MKPNVAEFHDHVVSLYDEAVGRRFLLEVGSGSEVTYSQALEALDRALLAGARPLVPGFGPMDSLPVEMSPPEGIKDAIAAAAAVGL